MGLLAIWNPTGRLPCVGQCVPCFFPRGSRGRCELRIDWAHSVIPPRGSEWYGFTAHHAGQSEEATQAPAINDRDCMFLAYSNTALMLTINSLAKHGRVELARLNHSKEETPCQFFSPSHHFVFWLRQFLAPSCLSLARCLFRACAVQRVCGQQLYLEEKTQEGSLSENSVTLWCASSIFPFRRSWKTSHKPTSPMWLFGSLLEYRSWMFGFLPCG